MSLCIIVADADGLKDYRLRLLQVIESLVYNRSQNTVSITFDIFLENHREHDCSLLLIHRGLSLCQRSKENLIVSQYLNPQPDNWEDLDVVSREEVLRAIYREWILYPSKNENVKPRFFERLNCFSMKKDSTPIDYCDPELFTINSELLINDKEWKNGVFPPFSAYTVSPFPQGNSWFRVEMNITGRTYDYLVDYPIHFWVDGPERVKNQILSEDIPQRGHLQPECEDFFHSRVIDHILEPISYDIVIYRPGTDGADGDICCVPYTGDEYLASISHHAIAKRAYRFVTRSTTFWIDLCYSYDPRLPIEYEKTTPLENVS